MSVAGHGQDSMNGSKENGYVHAYTASYLKTAVLWYEKHKGAEEEC